MAQTWLSIKQATKLRKFLLEDFDLLEVVSIRKKVFSVSVDNVISVFQNIETTPEIKVFEVTEKDSFVERTKVPQNIVNQLDILKSEGTIIDVYFGKFEDNVLNKVRKNADHLDALCLAKDGVKIVGPAKSFAFSYEKHDNSFFPMVIGKNIDRYTFEWGGLLCCRDKKKIEKHNASDIRLREEFIFKRSKILVRKTGHIIVATFDDSNYYYEQSLFSISKKDSESKIGLKFILGILNSTLSNYLLKTNPFSKKDTFPQIRLHWLKSFPIHTIDFSNSEEKARHDQMVTLVERMLELHKQLAKAKTPPAKTVLQRQIDTTDRQIDQLVYELYDLTEEEIKIVKESLK